MIYALWQGGVNYAASSFHDGDTETFPSIKAATDALVDRAKNGHWSPQDFTYADGRTERNLTPCADISPAMEIFLYDPTETDEYGRMAGENGPDRIISIGPRGGIRVDKN